jgi:hypothetical protein
VAAFQGCKVGDDRLDGICCLQHHESADTTKLGTAYGDHPGQLGVAEISTGGDECDVVV